ncbi:hypothetical protein ACRALDRAFT_1081804 [Sodiomyces alcalophilus JCM 7366]|uniref:uncharacterized protein n=1 Tax=Sodiomyces alcalophilus JCM 7366 TaxID=591952 RepID=UPI0039B698C4
MRSPSILSVVMAAAIGTAAQEERITGELGDAQIVTGNPPGLVYEAVLPDDPWTSGLSMQGNVQGSILAASAPDGIGVHFRVRFANLPQDEGPLSYHLHAAPVPADGNCSQTLAHLDPYIRRGSPPCDPSAPETCEVGDLSGKHGLIDPSEVGDVFEAVYVDEYASLIEGEGAFFGNRSFVLHLASDLTRVSCANFVLRVDGSPDSPPSNCTGSMLPPPSSSSIALPSGVPGPTGVMPSSSPEPTGSLVPVPTAAGAVSAVPLTLLGVVAVVALFGM